MNEFAALLLDLDRATGTNDRADALGQFFRAAPERDAVWGAALLLGAKLPRPVKTTLLRQWASEAAGVPPWLFEESYLTVGDLAETISLILPESTAPVEHSLADWIAALRALAEHPDEEGKKAILLGLWREMGRWERFAFTKLVTSGYRVGVARGLVHRALARAHDLPEALVAHRLMGGFDPDGSTLAEILGDAGESEDLTRPYPFQLCYALDTEPDALGPADEWTAEWKWDGIRAQLIRRADVAAIWTRGEELVTDRFPEVAEVAARLPSGTVLDGELVCLKDRSVLPFSILQRRIGRTRLTSAVLSQCPVGFIAYDLLEWEGQDIRSSPLSYRRSVLESLERLLVAGQALVSPAIAIDDWSALAELRLRARDMKAEGLMLKRRDSSYVGGRRRGDWWKWKLDPFSVDAVLLYAQAGHGRRANLYTDYTFAVWNGEQLVPFAKAYSGLTDRELDEITRYVRENTIERFGPVRSVTPSLVFEIAFEGIQRSPRHRSGLAVRFPRILRWRRDKRPEDANSLADLMSLIAVEENGG